MKKLLTLFLFCFIIAVVAADLNAQSRFSASLFAGYGSGAYEATSSGLGSGKLAFRANVFYTVMPILDAYVAYNRAGFTCSVEPFCGEAPVEFISSGFNIGLRLHYSLDVTILIPWLRAGLVVQTLDISQDDGGDAFNFKTDPGVGFEIGTGIAYPITEQIHVVPAFNYMRYTVTRPTGGNSAVVVLSYLAGVRYFF